MARFHFLVSPFLSRIWSGTLDLVKEINFKKENKGGPVSVVVFLGINGTGKTTTVAKVANLLHKNGLSVVLAASDTHRAGAIEQLGEHARRLSLKMIHQRYGADPSAVARDAVEYGKKHRVDAILIDTAGKRTQTAKNLMDEISKIVQVVKPDLKIFIGDSLAGNDASPSRLAAAATPLLSVPVTTHTGGPPPGRSAATRPPPLPMLPAGAPRWLSSSSSGFFAPTKRAKTPLRSGDCESSAAAWSCRIVAHGPTSTAIASARSAAF